MKSKLERKWWFAMPVFVLSIVCTIWLLRGAGIGEPEGAPQWLVYFLCLFGFQQVFTFVGWFGLVLLAPRSRALD
ncbi:hypothetical protein B0920_19755 [Massilia sp. KIM]|uniref:hypothetical protein n=1 Tax=Massilia sp. KIM TaxID=1955422 RepID=UPI00098F4429|nr:hypothetical protein [Massilia sp. KIM]OON61157.1 hypothetical protein B0920_19755 [Massilia sp. KIM]